MENYSLLMGAAAVMNMAVEMAAVSMEKPSGGPSPSRQCAGTETPVPRSWLRDGGGSSASTEVWRIIEEGYSPRDPRHLTRREVVDDQLNATAINMIHMAVTPKDRAHIRSLKTAKEAWDKLDKLFLGNESIQSSHFDEVNNMADNFVMIEGESPEEMYRRLIALAVQMQDLGATFVDDHWIKRKFYNALLPYEEVKLTAVHQNASFRAMTSDEVLSEVIALDISKKNAEDLVARAHNTRKPNLALNMREHGAKILVTKYSGIGRNPTPGFLCPEASRTPVAGRPHRPRMIGGAPRPRSQPWCRRPLTLRLGSPFSKSPDLKTPTISHGAKPSSRRHREAKIGGSLFGTPPGRGSAPEGFSIDTAISTAIFITLLLP
ncbi:hypothetical protein QYE76_056121 [Lolium multiflorum]|uniref:Uncharacterized protein n=1 Tax=Lolium multiflorum TaxID=4521 RepID=A0AAD8T110_LOLMU|nr:hypothetical protein QYE76_056121 [Lolium multiflorum]